MADKTWTATDLELGRLVIHARDGEVHLERRYKFLDSGGLVIPQIAGGRVVEDIPVASIPANILSALQELNTWTKDKALAQEGMD